MTRASSGLLVLLFVQRAECQSNQKPTLSTVTPTAGEVGDGDTVLTLTGTGFSPQSIVNWNGSDLTPLSVDLATRKVLTVNIPSAALTAVNTNSITVSNPSPGGGASNKLWFTVYAACGSTLTSMADGTPAKSNGRNTTTGQACYVPGDYGLQYECPEFVNRFYADKLPGGQSSRNWGGAAKTYLDGCFDVGCKQQGMIGYRNGGATRPDFGDVLVFDATRKNTHGHVAIVSNVTDTGISVIEQNWSVTGAASSGTSSWPAPVVSTNSYSVQPRGGAPILGWLRPSDRKPIGNFDGIDPTAAKIFGWAEDQDNLAAAVQVHIYIDKKAGATGASPIAIFASDPRPDVGNHGFNYVLPNSYRDGQNHMVWVWAIDLTDITGAHNIQLAGSPKTFNIPPANQPPTAGFVMTSGTQSVTSGQTLNVSVPPGGSALIDFTDQSHANNLGGSIAFWIWSVNGTQVSAVSSFSQSFSKGTYQISLFAGDNTGTYGPAATGTVVVTEALQTGPSELFQTALYNDPSLVAYWRFEGNSNDSKGTHNGTDTSVLYGNSYGKFGQGANFGGSSNIVIPDTSDFHLTAPYSISFWINPSVAGYGPFGYNEFLSNTDSSGNHGFLFVNYSDYYYPCCLLPTPPGLYGLQFYYGAGPYGQNANTTITSALTNGLWYHVALVDDGTRVTMYLNGSVAGTGPENPSSYAGVTGLQIGGINGNSQKLNGSLDDAAIFSRALTPAEVVSLYTGQAAPSAAVRLISDVGISGPGTDYFNLGWSFTISAPITVSALGFFDWDQDGFAINPPVGIFDAGTHALLAAITVTSSDPIESAVSTTDGHSGGFRYHDLPSPLNLPVGTYVIAGNAGGSDPYVSVSVGTTAPGVGFGQAVYVNGSGLLFPTAFVTDGRFAYFGPNFKFR